MRIWGKILVALALLVLTDPARAAGPFYVSATGSDGNDCLSWGAACLHPQHAADICPNADYCGIYLASSGAIYSPVNVNYYKTISLIGPNDGAGNCTLPNSVYIGALSAQDHATLTVMCVMILTSNVGVLTRQFAIADVDGVIFGGMNLGVSATEMSKINVCGARFTGNLDKAIAATGNSYISYGCGTTSAGITMNYFAYAARKAIIDGSGATFTGTFVGAPCLNNGSWIVNPPSGFPGSPAGCDVRNGGVME